MDDSDEDDNEPAKPKDTGIDDNVFAEGDEAVSERSNDDEDERRESREKPIDDADEMRKNEINKKTLA